MADSQVSMIEAEEEQTANVEEAPLEPEVPAADNPLPAEEQQHTAESAEQQEQNNNTASGSDPEEPPTPEPGDLEEADLGLGNMMSDLGPATSSAAPEMPDLSQPDKFSDVQLEVGGRPLYTCRGILASASPFWRKMFTADFREKDSDRVPLPGKKYEDVLELLLCLSPASQKPMSGENVLSVLPLADEWQLSKLKTDCETWLLKELENTPSQETFIRYLALAQKYSLEQLQVQAVEQVAKLSLEELEKHQDVGDLSQDTLMAVLRTRVATLETANAKSQNSATLWQKKTEALEDCLKKMSREKLTIKCALDEIEGSWELKGSETRCIDPVHIYGPRNYGCEKCCRQLHTYIQSKVWHLINRGSSWSGISWPQ